MMFFSRIAAKHLSNYWLLYFIVLLFFVAGISAGAFTADALSVEQKEELVNYFKGFFSILEKEPVYSGAVFKQSLANNLQIVILIWLLGITVIGVPLILLLIGVKGFIIGFSVGFLVEEMKLRGVLFALVAVLPQNLIIVPGIVVSGVLGIAFSTALIRRRKTRPKKSFFNELLVYTLNMLVVLLVISIGALVEGYITPIFIKAFAEYYPASFKDISKNFVIIVNTFKKFIEGQAVQVYNIL